MKLNAGKRVLMFFHWLFSLLICAAFAAYIIKPDFVMNLYNAVVARFGRVEIMIVGIAILAIYTILVIVQAWIIFHRGRRADRGFITVDSSDTGRVRIAISAIEQMVRQSVTNIDGIADMKIAIENLDDAIGINIAAVIQNGSHVPTITMNMQRAIRQFVEMNCGVAVRAVSISINSVSASSDNGKRRKGKKNEPEPAAAPVFTPQPEAPKAEPAPMTFHAPEPEPEPAPEPEPEPAPAYEIPDEPAPIVLHLDRTPAYDDVDVDVPELKPVQVDESAVPAYDEAPEDAEAPVLDEQE